MRQEPPKHAPILTLYLNYPQQTVEAASVTDGDGVNPPSPPRRLTDTLSLRYQAGEYQLLTQHNVTPLTNGETIMLDNLSITIQLEEPHIASIDAIMEHRTYHQLANTVPTLQRLREIVPIDTDHLSQTVQEETSEDPLSFLNIPASTQSDDSRTFPGAAYPGYSETKFTSLNQYFTPPTAAQSIEQSQDETAKRREQGNILRDLGFA
jgi:hypothetical protein